MMRMREDLHTGLTIQLLKYASYEMNWNMVGLELLILSLKVSQPGKTTTIMRIQLRLTS